VLNPEQGPPNEVDCQINLNETVSPGQQLNLSKTVNSPTEFTNGLTIDFFTHSRDEYDFKGIALDYFGARYYDPEIGTWTSTDPSDQYWNAYSYCGADPINSIDIDGCYSAPTVQVHPVQPIIQQTYNQVNVVQSLLADYNSLAYDQIYNLTSLSGIINYDYEYRYNAPSIDYNKLVNIINTVDPAMVANGADATGSYWQYEIQSEDPSTVAKAIGLLELIGLSTPIAQELIIAGFLTYMTYLAFHEDIGKLWHSGHGHYDKKTGKREDPHVHDLTKHTDPKTGKVRIKKGPGRAPKAGETK